MNPKNINGIINTYLGNYDKSMRDRIYHVLETYVIAERQRIRKAVEELHGYGHFNNDRSVECVERRQVLDLIKE